MHSPTAPARPEPGEFLPYYGQYIALVPEGDLLAILAAQIEETVTLLQALPPAAATRRPAPAAWSPLDIAVHLADCERAFAYRAFTFARMDGAELPGIEPDDFAVAAEANDRTVSDVVAELRAVRAASLALFRGLRPEAWTRRGIASGAEVSVRALAYIAAGHELHHARDLRRAASTE